MHAMLWHRFCVMVNPVIWPVIRRHNSLLAWISHVSPEFRLENRNGRLKGDDSAQQQLRSLLQPLDILVERGPMRVSDALIQGYFKHIAIYLGQELSEVVLEAMAGNGRQAATRYRTFTVLEATREGVRLVSLDEVLNVDSIGVLRSTPASPEEIDRIVSQTGRELGKEYDYVFDMSNCQRQFCSKLVSCLFPSLPCADFLGAGAVIVPDDYVWPVIDAQQGAPLLKFLIHDGVPIAPDQQIRVLKQLLYSTCSNRSHGLRSKFPWQEGFGYRVEIDSCR